MISGRPLRVLCSATYGDLFLVFDDNTASEIHDEDDLRDLVALRSRASDPRSTANWLNAGDEFRILREVECPDCHGSGEEEAAAWFEIDPDEGLPIFVACVEHQAKPSPMFRPWAVENHVHTCCECRGQRTAIVWTDERIARAELSLPVPLELRGAA